MFWTWLTNLVGAFNSSIFGEGGLSYSIVRDLFNFQVGETLHSHSEQEKIVMIRPGEICCFQAEEPVRTS